SSVEYSDDQWDHWEGGAEASESDGGAWRSWRDDDQGSERQVDASGEDEGQGRLPSGKVTSVHERADKDD
ncbi:unnamed protein product, partial [Durusdinium trenchii]